jgi:hypothetical protein
MPLNEMESRNLSKEDRDKMFRKPILPFDGLGAVEGYDADGEPLPADFVMAVGDVNSDEMGTAARANGGKAAFDLLPLEQVAYLMSRDRGIWETSNQIDAVKLVDTLANFQRNENEAYDLLYVAMAYHVNHSSPEIIKNMDMLGALEDVCHVWDYGRKKYAEWNWAKGAPWSVPIGCMMRHIRLQIIDGETMDVDSGHMHTSHIVCNAMMLVHYSRYWHQRAPEADNRPYQFFGLAGQLKDELAD